MQQRPLGRAGLLVSRLALGTMTWGRDTGPDDAAAQLKTFVDAGGNLLDTADVYGDGEAEAVIGTLLSTVVSRDDVLIATKAGLRPARERRRDTSRGHLLRCLDSSLDRLGVDHVDLWQVHGYDPETPLEETLSALDFAVSSGRARYVGISNFSGWETARAATWQAAWPGRAPLVCAQVEYSLLERGIEREVRYLDPRSSAIVESVVTAAEGLGVSPLEVALAWIRDQPGVVAPILGARTVGQLLGALQVEEITLPVEISRALADVSAIECGYPERQG
ncbi:MAG: aldo/keto reductase [Actinobacteria bacterium 13_2_20CM_2_71_6]|nr:MAG: aldo/keto reductase [Actinobacteria bacterium 13_2_20CM_2_71_6]